MFDVAERVKRERKQRERERAERAERERQERERRQRQAHLKKLADDWEGGWEEAFGLIDDKNRDAYAKAATLIVDLLEAAQDEHRRMEGRARVAQLREMYTRRYALMQELDRAGVPQ